MSPSFTRPIATPATADCDRHTGVHQREAGAANRGHGTGTIRFQNVADDAKRVGELFLIRNDRRNRAFRQRTVTDFTTARAAHETDFTDAERREIVVQHEALEVFASFEQLNALFVVLSAERDRDQRLGFAAREERRTMGAGQHAGFAPDVANFVELAAIGTAMRVQHLIAENAFLEVLEDFVGFRLLLFGHIGNGQIVRFVNTGVAIELGIFLRIQRVGQILTNLFLDGGVEFLVQLRSNENSSSLCPRP